MAQARQLTLTEEQRRDLRDCREHHPKVYVREKAAAILKVVDGQAVRQVAAYGLLRPRQPKKVGHWIDRYLAVDHISKRGWIPGVLMRFR